ncbi:zinc ribbon domain-containing protein [Marinobacter halodurans]|uniref:Zinc ribbon domain-containing protein n=1 Tax=Marinobacter halodurans TaxID=2528979 RepID=A0ABY1ZKW7_9GAMM|nr:zinc ribbon domain-containing protein [Marinobacter halodurans]TBW54655.1 zinc ribbon domain-containing protein [Marinobacter halodurans]
MPIYEYVCDGCGFEKDVIQKMSDAPLSVCPSCEAETFRKRISAAGFRLSGSGWYETDFKTGSKKNLAEKGGESGSGSKTEPAAG